MQIINCKQGSPEWLQARAGVITASNFEDAISVLKKASGAKVAGDPTGASDKYAGDVAIEIVSGKPYGIPVKAWVLDRGHELEGDAKMAYELRHDATVTESGIILTDDGRFGYSSDGLVGADGAVEVKCPIDSQKVFAMWETNDAAEYYAQIQGGLWITGRKWCDLIMFVPDLNECGKDLYVQRIARNDNYINELESRLWDFSKRVEKKVLFLRRGA